MIEEESCGSGSARGMLNRPLVWVALFGLLTLLAFGFFGLIFFQAKPAKPPAASDLFDRLSIERPEKTIRAPDFSLEDLSGKRLSLKDLKGKVVFLNFWATWCVPCRQEMPFMEALYREFKDRGLEVVAVNFREDKKTAQKFFAELGLTFKALVDLDGGVSNEYGAWSLPLTYVIDRKGEFVGKTIGDRKWYSEDARAFFRELLLEER
jgi:thiol-disulfide isomerase/thioredoxin